MRKIQKQISLWILLLLLCSPTAWGAPVAVAITPLSVQEKKEQPVLQSIRYSVAPQKVRIVFNVTTLPTVTANLKENPDQLVIDFEGVGNQVSTAPLVFNDPIVSGLQLSEVAADKQQVIINLNKAVTYKVFTLKGPNRVVIDIIKDLDQKNEEELAPGVKYTSWLHYMPAGPISTHIVELSPEASYILKPVLSNDAVVGLEKLQSMAERSGAIAAVNASYFALNGEVLGLLKMDGEIASTSFVDRTTLGLLPDGKTIMDVTSYSGGVTLPDGRTVVITGVNHERGTNDLILYNNHFDSMTGTNGFGSDYIVNNEKIIGIAHGNSAIPPGGVVLSAHGTMEKALAGLKVGDTIKISQTLGDIWDKTTDAIGAGPRLVKDGSVLVTGKEESFPSDITVGRAPRTAVGVTKEGHLILFVVDGRRQSSIGMTLSELAQFMQDLGAVDAMNFDGGGSSEMVIKGRAVNSPSDGHERSVGVALGIIPKN